MGRVDIEFTTRRRMFNLYMYVESTRLHRHSLRSQRLAHPSPFRRAQWWASLLNAHTNRHTAVHRYHSNRGVNFIPQYKEILTNALSSTIRRV